MKILRHDEIESITYIKPDIELLRIGSSSIANSCFYISVYRCVSNLSSPEYIISWRQMLIDWLFSTQGSIEEARKNIMNNKEILFLILQSLVLSPNLIKFTPLDRTFVINFINDFNSDYISFRISSIIDNYIWTDITESYASNVREDILNKNRITKLDLIGRLIIDTVETRKSPILRNNKKITLNILNQKYESLNNNILWSTFNELYMKGLTSYDIIQQMQITDINEKDFIYDLYTFADSISHLISYVPSIRFDYYSYSQCNKLKEDDLWSIIENSLDPNTGHKLSPCKFNDIKNIDPRNIPNPQNRNETIILQNNYSLNIRYFTLGQGYTLVNYTIFGNIDQIQNKLKPGNDAGEEDIIPLMPYILNINIWIFGLQDGKINLINKYISNNNNDNILLLRHGFIESGHFETLALKINGQLVKKLSREQMNLIIR